jgi:hypothetical protein
MPNPVDTRIAADNAALRAFHQSNVAPVRPPLPDRALIGERLADRDDDTGRKARTQMADALADVVKQVAILRRNPTMNAAQIEIAAADMVRARIDRLQDQLEGERAIVASRSKELATAMAAALRPPRTDWQAMGAEVRAVLRGMSDDEQELFLESLAGDDALMVQYAVAGVPPALSGVPYGVHKAMRDGLIERHNPELLTQPKDLAQRGAMLDVVEDGIRRTAAELVDFEQADALKALAGGDVP